MSNQRIQSAVVMTEPGILYKEHVWRRQAYRDPASGQESAPVYRIELALDTAAAKPLFHEVIPLAAKGLGTDDEGARQAIKSGMTQPLKKGDDLLVQANHASFSDVLAGKWVLRAKTPFNAEREREEGGIAVYDQGGQRLYDETQVHAGVKARATVVFAWYEYGAGKGVTAYLQGLQLVEPGERLATDVAGFPPVS